MANAEHVEILRRGGAHWNMWRKDHRGQQANLYRADLHKANLCEADLHGADLRMADLQDANLHSTNLSWADLSGADLSRAKLGKANLLRAILCRASLIGVDLTQASLVGVDLTEAKLTHANLGGADFTEVEVSGTHFGNVDLSTAKKLETVRHLGPSTIGIDSIYKSRGRIPALFLRGCGLSNWEIETTKLYDPSLSTAEATDVVYRVVHLRGSQPFQYYSCFISYSTKDQEFAVRLHADLQAKGVRCWFAPHDIQGGRKLHDQIDEAIRLHDKLLLILSKHSIASEWVKTEIAKARKREAKESKRVLFPVRLMPFDVLRDWECFDADTGKDSAREIREYFIPDFSNWDKDSRSYKTAFERLVKDLKAETSKGA